LTRDEQPKNMQNQQRSVLIFKRDEAPKSADPGICAVCQLGKSVLPPLPQIHLAALPGDPLQH